MDWEKAGTEGNSNNNWRVWQVWAAPGGQREGFMNRLPQPPACWDYRLVLPLQAHNMNFVKNQTEPNQTNQTNKQQEREMSNPLKKKACYLLLLQLQYLLLLQFPQYYIQPVLRIPGTYLQSWFLIPESLN